MTSPAEDRSAAWDESYGAEQPPWDIDRPQPAFVALADQGLLAGPVLDVGCGTGEHTLLAAERGADALGVDVAPRAIARATRKAAERGISARFQVADALDLGTLRATFITVLDSGLFHVFSDEERPRYVASLATALRPGGTCYLMCFSDRQPGDFGPRRVTQTELTTAFAGPDWELADIAAAEFEVRPMMGTTTAQAWLATVIRR
jgi:SAM-dependent methyltransferase